ncbi:nucleotide-binding universal stress UspA family protein [Hamadaea flava]|uniref:Universal stress protein n=1 Tax=Hamadaea flava TaxID=1742688 RepID=A0ABV8LNC1_9ACTN|nr:universal stress protein [Hamadaea flava]MCP2322903.1 nucleotide-binding universal stress UspA family protein [Hamadaea flava]
MTSLPIVAGVDGSPESLAAAAVAAREAVLRGVPVRIVHGFIWPAMRNVPLGPAALGPAEGGLENQARQIVAEGVAAVRAAAPGVEVTGEVITGSAAQALIRASGGASIVVVGDRGLGAFAGLLAGSVSIHVAAHAACPVMVVRGTTDPSTPVLLAVDGSPAGDAAVGFAFQEAALRNVPLWALHVWAHPTADVATEMQPLIFDESVARENEERLIIDALARWRTEFPDVDLRTQVVHGRVRRTILEATRGAQIIVLGSRGFGGFKGMLLGSVSQAALYHSDCPVVIVPGAQAGT